MTDTDRYFAAWVELDRIHDSDMTDAEKNAAIEAVIQSHNMDALWPNVDTERFHAMTQQYEQIDTIKKRLDVLVGLPVAGFMRSYGDELTLHLGELRPYSSERMKHLQRGSYVISTRASLCRLAPYDPPDSSTSHTVKSVSV